MKKIAIVTRDCAGINAAIRAVVRTASFHGIEVIGAQRGYAGLMDGHFITLKRRSVSGIINLGGTILKTARAIEFYTEEGQKKAVKTIKDNKIDGVVVIGGNGSLTAANILSSKYQIPTVGIPATIDNDVYGIPLTIGTDTAVNVAVSALDNIRDTATSLERIFVVEVMGRECGYIALHVALAGGCEEVILPEKKFDLDVMCEEIAQGNAKGKVSWIIITAEGKAKAEELAQTINKRTGLETRAVVLGHIQRGGRPTAVDRIMAARFGNYAVELLKSGKHGVYIGLNDDSLFERPLTEITLKRKIHIDRYYKLIKILT